MYLVGSHSGRVTILGVDLVPLFNLGTLLEEENTAFLNGSGRSHREYLCTILPKSRCFSSLFSSYIMLTDLRGRVVVVTGASGRLGQAVVQTLAHAGATVAAVVLSEEEAQKIQFPPDAPEGWAYLCDVTDENSVYHAFSQIYQELGPIYGLVHTVGTWASSPLASTTLEGWYGQLTLNLTSTFLCFRAAIPMVAPVRGHLVAISSRQGAERGLAEQAAYSAAKAGIVRLVESVADEHKGVLGAYAIAPSVLLADEQSGPGVTTYAVADIVVNLLLDDQHTLSGNVLKAYGTA